MSAGGKGVKVVEQMEADLVRQIDELQIKLATVREMKRKMTGEAEPVKGRRGLNVKTYLFSLLQKQAEHGLNANQAVEIAAKEGKTIERGTVSSLLSRFKAEGSVTYDGVVYRLPQFSDTTPPANPDRPENVVRHPASKAAS